MSHYQITIEQKPFTLDAQEPIPDIQITSAKLYKSNKHYYKLEVIVNCSIELNCYSLLIYSPNQILPQHTLQTETITSTYQKSDLNIDMKSNTFRFNTWLEITNPINITLYLILTKMNAPLLIIGRVNLHEIIEFDCLIEPFKVGKVFTIQSNPHESKSDNNITNISNRNNNIKNGFMKSDVNDFETHALLVSILPKFGFTHFTTKRLFQHQTQSCFINYEQLRVEKIKYFFVYECESVFELFMAFIKESLKIFIQKDPRNDSLNTPDVFNKYDSGYSKYSVVEIGDVNGFECNQTMNSFKQQWMDNDSCTRMNGIYEEYLEKKGKLDGVKRQMGELEGVRLMLEELVLLYRE